MNVCRMCGGEFSGRMPHAVYCSEDCRQDRNREKWRSKYYRRKAKRVTTPVARECAACGELFKPWQRRQRLCSLECGRALTWARRRKIRACAGCGGEWLLKADQKFCGERCRARASYVSPPTREGSMVYFVQMGDDGPIKIGFSSVIERRVSHMQNGNPYPLRLLRTMPGGPADERKLHHRFARWRLQGEWFEPTPELVALARNRPQLELVA